MICTSIVQTFLALKYGQYKILRRVDLYMVLCISMQRFSPQAKDDRGLRLSWCSVEQFSAALFCRTQSLMLLFCMPSQVTAKNLTCLCESIARKSYGVIPDPGSICGLEILSTTSDLSFCRTAARISAIRDVQQHILIFAGVTPATRVILPRLSSVQAACGESCHAFARLYM